ncbi:MAG: hypothetical protein V3T72_04815 [Thermoanaerobaculia bacterium]
MESTKIPLIILGGRDRAGTQLPEAGRGKHVLRGYKAIDLRIAGRPLINILLDRLRACDRFDPIYVAGPRDIYEPVVTGVRFIDTDGTFGGNIRVSLEAVGAELPVQPIAFISCDILPKAEELERALDDYERHRPLDFWALTIRAPVDPHLLGESAWKPKYDIQPEGEDQAVGVMPGHLAIVEPESLRLRLLYIVFDAIYRTRNRPLAYRRAAMGRTLVLTLIGNDLRRILKWRWPTYTWSLASNGLAIVARLMAGNLKQRELETRLHRAVARERHRKAHPERRGRFAILDGLSLAKDIDTEEEAREIARVTAET